MNRRNHRRNRISAADAGSKVYTATGDKAVKLDKSDVKRERKSEPETIDEKQVVVNEVREVKEVAQATAKASEPVVAEVVVEAPATSVAADSVESSEKPAPKKRGRKPKNKPAAEAQPVSATRANHPTRNPATEPVPNRYQCPSRDSASERTPYRVGRCILPRTVQPRRNSRRGNAL